MGCGVFCDQYYKCDVPVLTQINTENISVRTVRNLVVKFKENEQSKLQKFPATQPWYEPLASFGMITPPPHLFLVCVLQFPRKQTNFIRQKKLQCKTPARYIVQTLTCRDHDSFSSLSSLPGPAFSKVTNKLTNNQKIKKIHSSKKKNSNPRNGDLV